MRKRMEDEERRAGSPGINDASFLFASSLVFFLCSSVRGTEGGRFTPPGHRELENELRYLRMAVGAVRFEATSRSFLADEEQTGREEVRFRKRVYGERMPLTSR